MKLLTTLSLIGCAAALAARTTASAAPPPADIRRDATVIAVERVMPAVVNIRTETVVERHDPFERLLQEFWGPYYRQRGPETTYSLGSGVIIDEEGWVLTNFHVVNRATRVFIRTADGREFEAERIVGTSFTDVALLRIRNPKEQFPTIRFAADDDLLLGETVIALGNPFGLGGSVSRGILSSKSRRPPMEDAPLEVEDWLQTDAAINPGNSGGPLVNLRGELVGVSVAVHREGQGIGFAIPVRRVSGALGEMFSPEVLQSLWFGARVRPGSAPLEVVSVQPESPAGKAGLRVGDQIVEVNGKAPRRFIEFVRQLVDAGTMRTIALVVQRGRERRPASVRLVKESTFFNPELVRKKIGILVEELTPQAAAALDLGDRRGVIINEVERNSPAARAGLQKNMIITMVDGQVTWRKDQPAPSYVPVAKALYARAPGEKSRLEVIVPRRVGRYLELPRATVEVTVR
jgi:S1-C subfamily serine protease